MWSVAISLALKSTAILGTAWLVAFLLRRRSAAARHLVWTAAAAALIALPLLSVSLPALPIRALAVNSNVLFRVSAVPAQDEPSALGSAALGSGTAGARVPSQRVNWPFVLLLLWGAGALAGLGQMIYASAWVARMRRNAGHFAATSDVRDSLELIGVRHVEIRQSPSGTMPMAFGVVRPTVFLPPQAHEWTEERRRLVLLHELAHVRRGDIATHLLARMALSLYWWNPLAWTAWRQFLKERERATDDLVLHAGARASDYAGHLLEIARSMQPSAATAWAAVAMARRSQLEGRLLSILDSQVNRRAPGRGAMVAATLAAVAMVAPLASMRAQDTVPADVDATIRAAISQKNYAIVDRTIKAYLDLHKYDVAQKLLETSLAIRGQEAGEQSVEYGQGLIQLGDLARKRQDPAAAKDYYSRAVTAMGERPESAPALLELGVAQLIAKNKDDARQKLEHAAFVDPSGPSAGPALTWLAVMRQREEDGAADAEALYQRALSVEDPKSTDAATTMELYSQFLGAHDRGPEAEELAAKAKGLRRQGRGPALRPADAIAGAVKVGPGMTPPKLLSKVEPQYTQEARVSKYQGTAILSVVIGTDGLAHDIQVSQSLGMGLDEKAIEAVEQWTFQPGMKDGMPVPVMAQIEVNFRLM